MHARDERQEQPEDRDDESHTLRERGRRRIFEFGWWLQPRTDGRPKEQPPRVSGDPTKCADREDDDNHGEEDVRRQRQPAKKQADDDKEQDRGDPRDETGPARVDAFGLRSVRASCGS